VSVSCAGAYAPGQKKSILTADRIDRAILQSGPANGFFALSTRLAMDEAFVVGLCEVIWRDFVAELAMDTGPVDVISPGCVALKFVSRIRHERRISTRKACFANKFFWGISKPRSPR
jgi:hypothetical protein